MSTKPHRDAAKFAIQRNGVDYSVSGYDIQLKCEEGDTFYVQRGDTVYQWPRKEFAHPWEKKPFWYHVKNLTQELFVWPRDEEHTSIWDAVTEEKVDRMVPADYTTGSGEYIIGGYNDAGHTITFEGNAGNWDFGEMTGVELLNNGNRFFADCQQFNGDISPFAVCQWQSVTEMFRNCYAFNQDISGWDITHIYNNSDIIRMLYNCRGFYGNLSSWCMHDKPGNSGNEVRLTENEFCWNSNIQALPAWCCKDHQGVYENESQTRQNPGGDSRAIGTFHKLQPNDLFVCTDEDGVTYRVPYAELDDVINAAEHVLHVKNIRNGELIVSDHTFVTNLMGEVINETVFTDGEWLINGALAKLEDSTANWDFGPLTNTEKRKGFSNFLKGCESFNGDISYLRTSNAEDVSYMFSYCKVFNQPVDNLDTKNARSMRAMFQQCNAFDQPVNHFNTSMCESFMLTFQQCHKFNQPLDNWDTSRSKSNNSTFDNATLFNQDISNWDLSKSETTKNMFRACKDFNQDLSPWNTKNVKDMISMFHNCSKFNQDLSLWCTPKVNSFSNFLYGTPIYTDTSKYPQWRTCPRGEDQIGD